MKGPTIALGIPHTPWVPARVESHQRLLAALFGPLPGHVPRPSYVIAAQTFGEKAANHIWSSSMWAWGIDQDASHFLSLQDDVIPGPHFWPALRAMLEAVPDQVIGLEAAHPAGPQLAKEGHCWYTTSDFLVGVQYVLPCHLLREFLVWRSSALIPRAVEVISEDTLIGLWCLATGRRIWHPIPAIADHDTSLDSTYGNDSHENRRPTVLWNHPVLERRGPVDRLTDPDYWRPLGNVPHLGRMYPKTPTMLRHALAEKPTEAQVMAWKHDDGADVQRPMRLRMLAGAYKDPQARILVCTPYRGGLHPEHVASVMRLQAVVGLDVRHELELDNTRHEHEDLVRVRSRMVREFLASDCTHLLFVDADNAFATETVLGMLRTGKDFVQAPYMRRDGRGYTIRANAKVRKQGAILPEDLDGNTVEIECTGFGLTLLSRGCLERMIEVYSAPLRLRYTKESLEALVSELAHAGVGHENPDDFVRSHFSSQIAAWIERQQIGHDLTFLDGDEPTVALFQLEKRDAVLLSEDTSFAARWRDIGGKIWMYVGAGTPIAHYGEANWQGKLEDLGLARAKS